jgi:DNA-binding NarL/FixJ family response regulator
MATRILLAEDHLVVRDGLRALLEHNGFEVIAEAADGREAVEQAGRLRPDVAILDLFMPTLNGIDAAREIGKVSPRTRTILLTGSQEIDHVVTALQSGVTGYVEKSRASADLILAVREVAQGAVYLSKGTPRDLTDAYLNGGGSRERLSPRERQVLQLVAEGKSTKEAASVLGISVKTAESHRTRIMRKLDVHETASLVRYAIRHGLVQP